MSKLWTAEDDRILRALYPATPTHELAAQLGRTQNALHRRAHNLGVLKAVVHRQSNRGCFPAGNKPWNAGLKGWHSGGRSAETRFKPGRDPSLARNYLPIGSLRICHDGRLERKVTDDPCLSPARRWTAVSRLVWEAAHGPVPAKHIVVFKPGMATAVLEQITLDRLECISRKENANRNHPRSRHPEYARLVQLKGAITRQVNRIVKQSQEATP